ncbi:MAG TPA: response regulator [Bacteroidota bacterium]|nr:response regulator [Bacteroidota bacterium]
MPRSGGRDRRFAYFSLKWYTSAMSTAPAPIRVLFVDDDTSYMAVAQHLLSKYQGTRFDILWKQSGRDALEVLGKNPEIDLILMDYHLPEDNGLEVTRQIREKNIDIPIIFLTSNRDFRLAIEAMKYGVEDYLVKDEAVDSVLPRTIVNILERVRLKKQIAERVKADLIAKNRTNAIKELIVTVCHEFNNPLAAIKISTDILLRQSLTSGERSLVEGMDRNVGLVEKEIARLRDLDFDATAPSAAGRGGAAR